MLYGIKKDCAHEYIIYLKIDDNRIVKSHYNENNQKTKEKEIDVREICRNGKRYKNVYDFIKDLIFNYGYRFVILSKMGE